jgi:hypothetical protein
MSDRRIGHRDFTDGTRRPVHTDPDGRQYVIGNDGERVCATWLREWDGVTPPPFGAREPVLILAFSASSNPRQAEAIARTNMPTSAVSGPCSCRT